MWKYENDNVKMRKCEKLLISEEGVKKNVEKKLKFRILIPRFYI